jgi:hypothetical protein
VHLVVQAGDGLSQGLDAGRGAVLAAGGGDVDVGGPRETAGDVVLDLRLSERVMERLMMYVCRYLRGALCDNVSFLS